MNLKMLASAVALAALGSTASAAPSLFATVDDSTFLDDPATGALTTLASPAGAAGRFYSGLATDAHATVWGVDFGDFPNPPCALVTFDHAGHVSASKTITYQGVAITLAKALSFGPGGRLWVAFHAGADEVTQAGHLGVIDPATGVIAASPVVEFSGGRVARNGDVNDGDMIEWVGGTLYVADNAGGESTTLYTVDVATGVQSFIGETRDATTVYQLTDIAWDGARMWGESYTGYRDANSGRLVEIDLASAQVTVVGPAAGRTIADGLTVTRPARKHHHDDDDDDCDEHEHEHDRDRHHGRDHRHHHHHGHDRDD